MISKSIFVRLLTNSLSPAKRNFSLTSQVLDGASKSKQSRYASENYCYAIANQADYRKVEEFYKENFVCNDPLIRSLYPCERLPDEIKRFHNQEICCPSFTILAKDITKDTLVGVAVNFVLKKDYNRICKYLFLKDARVDHNLKKYFQVLSQLYQTPMLHRELRVDEIVKVSPTIASECSPEILRNLIHLSFNEARSRNYEFSSIHSTTAQTRYAAELLQCDKFWSKCYQDVLTQQSFKPPSIPKPPNDSLSVFVKNLNEMC